MPDNTPISTATPTNGAASGVPGFTRNEATPTSTVSQKLEANPSQAAPKGKQDGTAISGEPKPIVTPPTEAKPTDDHSKQLASLQRRERALVESERRTKAAYAQREAQHRQAMAELEQARQEIAEFNRRRDAARANPLEWLKFGGHSYESASQQQLNQGKPLPENEIAALRQELDERLSSLNSEAEEVMRQEEEARQKRIEQRKLAQQREQQANYQRFTRDSVKYIQDNAKDYKYTTMFQQEAQVPALVATYYQQTLEQDAPEARREGRRPRGIELSVPQAAKLVEDHLASLYKKAKDADSATTTSVETENSNKQVSQEVQQRAAPGQRPEITNRDATNSSHPNGGEWVPPEERWKRAMAALSAPGSVRQGPR